MDKKKIYFGILIVFSLFLISSASAIIINNVTIKSSGGDSLYSNYSNISKLEVNNVSITITKAFGKSLFTALSNLTTKIRGLTSPYDNIYFDYANTIISTINEDIILTIGQKLLIYGIGEGSTTIINNYGGGGGTRYVEIRLYSLEIKNPAWYKNQKNIIYAYTKDLKENPIDVEYIDFSGAKKEERIGKGIYKATYKTGSLNEIKIIITARDKTKTISKTKIIKIDSPTIENKAKNTITGFGIKTINLFMDKTISIIFGSILIILLSVTISIIFVKKKK